MKPVSRARWQKIRLLAMDVDGILTDGTIHTTGEGCERKTFSVLDGLGFIRLREAGYPVAWISGRHSPATTARAEEIGVSFLLQDRKDKAVALQEVSRELRLEAEQVCYMGDDIIDIPALQWAGIGVAVPNALPEVKIVADWITRRPGGSGAVREVCDRLLANRLSSQ